MSARALVEDVSDTARWVAYYRAVESDRPDALFRDPFARRLAGERGRALAETLPQGPLYWAIPVRTRVFDELILETIERESITVVLNLAAGLDTRPYRLSLPSSLRWIEIDRPGLLAAKEEALAGERPRCELERVPLDLANRDARGHALMRFAAVSERVLVVTEGLLAYLDEADVRGLSDDLHAAPAVRAWLLESAHPEVLARQPRAWGEALRAGRAEMKFAPASGLGFFRRHGWVPRVERSCTHEAQRLGREMRFAPLLRALSTLTAAGRERWRSAVVYAVMERRGSLPDGSPAA